MKFKKESNNNNSKESSVSPTKSRGSMGSTVSNSPKDHHVASCGSSSCGSPLAPPNVNISMISEKFNQPTQQQGVYQGNNSWDYEQYQFPQQDATLPSYQSAAQMMQMPQINLNLPLANRNWESCSYPQQLDCYQQYNSYIHLPDNYQGQQDLSGNIFDINSIVNNTFYQQNEFASDLLHL